MTICPHCKNLFSYVNIEPVSGQAGTKRWNCISHNCPHCHASLGVQIDPIAIKTGMVNELKRP